MQKTGRCHRNDGRCCITGKIAGGILACLVFFICGYGDDKIRYTADSDRLPAGAAIAGMGDVGVALPKGASSALWNPAAPALLSSGEVSAEGADLYRHLSQHGCFSGTIPLKKDNSVAISYLPFYSGVMEEYDTIPEMLSMQDYLQIVPTGHFRNYHHIFAVALAHKWSLTMPRLLETDLPLPLDIATGINFKTYMQMMDPKNTCHLGLGYNIDIGTIMRIGLDYDLKRKKTVRHLYLGVSVRDALPSDIVWINSVNDTWRYSPSEYREPFSIAHYYGIAFTDISHDLPIDWTVALSLHKEYEVSYHAGLEVTCFDKVDFRAGISGRTPTFGAGFRHNRLFVDYAFRLDPVAMSYARLTAGYVISTAQDEQ